ncbi:MAG: hypothetical protein Q9207_004576 [Kuettlingeria erythrocarpa]
MADVFATIAGVVSVIDVALRGCNVLYSSLHYLKDAPQLSHRLRQTIQSVESVLRCLDEFVAVYRQQQASAGLPGCLPHAVNHEVIFIKAELDTLSTLLPAPSVSGQLRRRAKSLLDRKRVIEVTEKLNDHQITLTLALQSFAQQNGINFQEQLTQTLGRIERQHGSNATEVKEKLDSVSTGLYAQLGLVTQACGDIRPAQERLDAGLNDLHGLVSIGQNVASDKLDAIQISLSQVQADRSHVRSSTILSAPTADVLARIFRAELQRVMVPTVQQCFDTLKKNPDQRLDEMMRKINEMAQQLGSMSGETVEDRFKPSDHLMNFGVESTHNHQDLTDLTVSCTPDLTAFGTAKRQNKIRGRRIRHWRRSWIFRWTIGTLWVTVSTTTTTDRKTSPEFRIGEIRYPQKAYRVTTEFQPAQSLLQLRGLTLSVTNTQDQRGYSQIGASVSTFAVVPWNADVMQYASDNNVEGIRDLFERRLAAPSDRDEFGRTSLMVYLGLHKLLKDAQHPSLTDEDYVKVVELLLQAEEDVIEHSMASAHSVFMAIDLLSVQQGELSRRTTFKDSLYLQRLKEMGFTLNGSDYGSGVLFQWAFHCQTSENRFSSAAIEPWLRTLLDLGADICAVDNYGNGLLHDVFLFPQPFSKEAWLHNTREVLTALMKNGADPFALNYTGRSVFDDAERYDQMPVLMQSLERAGYDVNEVRDEIERRQWCFFNPDHGYAESTAVDDAQIGPPSAEGLVLRKGVHGDRLEE